MEEKLNTVFVNIRAEEEWGSLTNLWITEEEKKQTNYENKQLRPCKVLHWFFRFGESKMYSQEMCPNM